MLIRFGGGEDWEDHLLTNFKLKKQSEESVLFCFVGSAANSSSDRALVEHLRSVSKTIYHYDLMCHT